MIFVSFSRRGDDFELRKRVDLNTLYNNVPRDNNVALGGSKYFKIDLTKSATYTTAYFYGCTVVIVVDGGDLIISSRSHTLLHRRLPTFPRALSAKQSLRSSLTAMGVEPPSMFTSRATPFRDPGIMILMET